MEYCGVEILPSYFQWQEALDATFVYPWRLVRRSLCLTPENVADGLECTEEAYLANEERRVLLPPIPAANIWVWCGWDGEPYDLSFWVQHPDRFPVDLSWTRLALARLCLYEDLLAAWRRRWAWAVMGIPLNVPFIELAPEDWMTSFWWLGVTAYQMFALPSIELLASDTAATEAGFRSVWWNVISVASAASLRRFHPKEWRALLKTRQIQDEWPLLLEMPEAYDEPAWDPEKMLEALKHMYPGLEVITPEGPWDDDVSAPVSDSEPEE